MKKLIFASILIAGSALSQAATLVDQSESTGPYGGAWEDLTGSQILADSFTLSSNATINEYDFYGIETQASSYTLVLYADSGSSTPGATLVTLGSLTPSSFTADGNYGGYEAIFSGLSINVKAGVKYWIDVSGNGSDAGCFTTNPCSNGDGAIAFESSPAGPWTNYVGIGDLTYALKGSTTPEPASMAALGLGVLALIRRRTSK